MVHAIKEKIFNIMRAHKFADIFCTLLELEFKFPLYQQVKFLPRIACYQASFHMVQFSFPS